MSDLKINLQEILQEKQEKIIPENIKKDVQIFDVVGTLEGGTTASGVKLFETEEEMQADSTAQEGDLAVVYREEIQNMTATTQTQYITFPETVVLPEAFADDVFCMLRAVDESAMFDGQVMLNQSMFNFNGYSETGMIQVSYQSEDGITYTRQEFMGDSGALTNPVDLGVVIGVYSSEEWNDMLGYFMQVGGNVFDGLYERIKAYGNTVPEKYVSPFLLNSFYITDGYRGTLHYSQCEEQYDTSKLANLIKNMGVKNSDNSVRRLLFTVDVDNNMYFVDNISETNDYGVAFSLLGKKNEETNIVTLDNNKMVSSAEGLNIYQISSDYSSVELIYNNVQPISAFINGGTSYYIYEELPIKLKTYGVNIGYYFTNDAFDVFGGVYSSSGDETETKIYYVFQGTYIYANISPIKYWSEILIWTVASNQYTLTSSNQLLPNISAYGKNGNIVGDGSIEIPNNTFADIPAQLYYNIQNQYNNMEPRVLTNSDKTIDKNIYLIPTKSDGTVLLDTSNVTDMSGMFEGCTNLTTIPLLDTSNVTNMGTMFSSCSSLTVVPKFNTNNVTNMHFMFSNCNSLVMVPEFDTSNVTLMNSMFVGCNSLTTVPEFDTSNVSNMHAMFNGCVNLTTIPEFNMSDVTNMPFMFTDCGNLTDESLNNILASLKTATSYTKTKTLKQIGLSQEQATTCTTLSNWSACEAAGWTTGY